MTVPEELPEDLAEHEALLKIVEGVVPAPPDKLAAILGTLSAQLEVLGKGLFEADRTATDLAEKYSEEYDLAFLASGYNTAGEELGISVTERKAKARVATAQRHLDMEVAQLNVRRIKNNIDILSKRIMEGQSYLKTVRAEYQTFSYGQRGV